MINHKIFGNTLLKQEIVLILCIIILIDCMLEPQKLLQKDLIQLFLHNSLNNLRLIVYSQICNQRNLIFTFRNMMPMPLGLILLFFYPLIFEIPIKISPNTRLIQLNIYLDCGSNIFNFFVSLSKSKINV